MNTSETSFNTVQKKNMVVRVVDYKLIAGHLYKMGADSTLRRCVMEHERPRILVEAQEGIAGGHYVGKGIMHRTMVVDCSQRLKGLLPEMLCMSEGW
jgi:hypothetical protein